LRKKGTPGARRTGRSLCHRYFRSHLCRPSFVLAAHCLLLRARSTIAEIFESCKGTRFAVRDVGYLSIISASPPQPRATVPPKQVPLCRRTRRVRRTDPCAPRLRSRFHCRRVWAARVLTVAIAGLAFAEGAFAGLPAAEKAPPTALRADIGKQQAPTSGPNARKRSGITGAAALQPPALRQSVASATAERAVVSRAVPFSISRARGTMSSASSNSVHRTPTSSPIARRISARTSVSITPSIHGRIDASNNGQNRDARLMLRIGVGLGLAYLAFLVLWLWATRLRPGAQRSARA
jgi:hypothetical protein